MKYLDLPSLDVYFKTSFDITQLKMVIKDLKQTNDKDLTPLTFALLNNDSLVSLKPREIGYLIENSNLRQLDKNGRSPIYYAIEAQKAGRIQLTPQYWKILIENSDLKHVDKFEISPLALFLSNNDNERFKVSRELYSYVDNYTENWLNLSKDLWTYLFENSNLKQLDCNGLSIIETAKIHNGYSNLNLPPEQFAYLLVHSGVDTKNIDNPRILFHTRKIESELLAIRTRENEEFQQLEDIQQSIIQSDPNYKSNISRIKDALKDYSSRNTSAPSEC